MPKLSPAQRRAQMARIPRADTAPERIVRRLLHSMGYRFPLQLKGGPGGPDIAFQAWRKALKIQGCFRHGMTSQPSGSEDTYGVLASQIRGEPRARCQARGDVGGGMRLHHDLGM